MKMNSLDKAVYLLLVIGGINWGLVGAFEYNLVDKIFSEGLARVIYSVVGLAAVYGIVTILTMMSSKKR